MSYSAKVGRWIEQDPDGYVDSMNPYEFVLSSSTDFDDPQGTDAEPTTDPIPIQIDQGTVSDHLTDLTQQALDDVLATNRGKELVAQLRSEGRVITIRLNRHQQNDGTTDKSNKVKLAPLQEDPVHVTVQGKDGKRRRIVASLPRLLAHELGHAVTGTGDTGPDKMDNVNQNENPIVTELGEDLESSIRTCTE